MVCRPKPSRWLLSTGTSGRLIGISWKLGPTRRQLGVDVGEEPPLQQRIVGEIDPRHDVTGMERHLLGLGEEVVRVAVERHLADLPYRNELLGDDLGRIEQVEAEFEFVLLLDDLEAQLPFGEVAALDGFVQVAPIEVRVLA